MCILKTSTDSLRWTRTMIVPLKQTWWTRKHGCRLLEVVNISSVTKVRTSGLSDAILNFEHRPIISRSVDSYLTRSLKFLSHVSCSNVHWNCGNHSHWNANMKPWKMRAVFNIPVVGLGPPSSIKDDETQWYHSGTSESSVPEAESLI